MEQSDLQKCLEDRIRRHGPDGYVNLVDSNFLDNGFLFPPDILRESLAAWLDWRRYRPDPRGEEPARRAIADFYRQGGLRSRPDPAHPLAPSPDDFILTASSSESYNLLFQTFCSPGDNILLPSPGYPLFEDLAAANGLEPRFYPLMAGDGWRIDCPVMEALADEKTRFAVLISPNNPCGSIVDPTTIAAVGKLCLDNDIHLICDEVFSEFLYTGDILPRPAALLPNVDVFTINGISKTFALPDLKLSWLLVSGPRKDAHLAELELRNDTFLNCNTAVQRMLPDFFARGAPFVRAMVDALAANRRLWIDFVRHRLPQGFWASVPDGGIHGIVSCSRYAQPDGEALACELLSRHGLYLHPASYYGYEETTALVFSLLKSPVAFSGALDILAEALAGLAT